MTRLNSSKWVEIPAELRPTRIQKSHIESFTGIQVRVKSDGSWSIIANEDYSNSSRANVEITKLATGNQFDPQGMRTLQMLSPITDSTPQTTLENYSTLRQNQLRIRNDQEPGWHKFKGEIPISLNQDLEETLRNIQVSAHPGDTLWIVEFNLYIQRRFSFMRLLFAHRFTPAAITNPVFQGFPAMQALMFNTISSFTVYIDPILILQSPWVWGLSALRPNSAIVKLFNEPEAGRPAVWTDLLDTFTPSWADGDLAPTIVPQTLSTSSREEIFKWWVGRVGKLLWIVSNPTNFEDKLGNYDVRAHVSTTLTTERIFVLAVEIARLKTKDRLLRKLLLFEILDTLKGHNLGNYEKNLNYTKEYSHWLTVKNDLPIFMQEALSPVIESGFNALKNLDNHFWTAKTGTDGDELFVHKKGGISQESIKLNVARADFLKSVRNSLHGFQELLRNPRNLSLLASHTGKIDDDLPDIVWWILLKIVINPDQMASRLCKQGSNS